MKKQITRSYLEYLGVKDVTRDGRVFTKRGELKPFLTGRNKRAANQDRLTIKLHDSEKYKAVPKEKRNDSSGLVNIGLHQAVFAWFNIEIPYGKQIHHKDGNYLNNSLDNLEALSPEEHRALHTGTKIVEPTSTREAKCRLDVPRSWYEKKLEESEKAYKEASANNDTVKAINAASIASHTRARLRYYDSHIEEARKLNEFNKDLIELAAWKATFKENNNKKLWHECCKIEKMVKENGINDWPIVKHALEVAHKYFGRREANENLD